MSGAVASMTGASSSRRLINGNLGTAYGFAVGSGYGALAPTEFLSSNITRLNWDNTNSLFLDIANTSQPNSGWVSININGNVFLRTSASYTAGTWRWNGVSNPFGTTVGAVLPVDIA